MPAYISFSPRASKRNISNSCWLYSYSCMLIITAAARPLWVMNRVSLDTDNCFIMLLAFWRKSEIGMMCGGFCIQLFVSRGKPNKWSEKRYTAMNHRTNQCPAILHNIPGTPIFLVHNTINLERVLIQFFRSAGRKESYRQPFVSDGFFMDLSKNRQGLTHDPAFQADQ